MAGQGGKRGVVESPACTLAAKPTVMSATGIGCCGPQLMCIVDYTSSVFVCTTVGWVVLLGYTGLSSFIVEPKTMVFLACEQFPPLRSTVSLMVVPHYPSYSWPLKTYPWLLLNLYRMIRLGLHPRTLLSPSRDSAGRIAANA
ncbi:hypothetical protein GOODEAATRI_020530 [Goodea atripinnis]|uniref:Uncharacterized protein n=1 Tax=Goodea atripinnis TaxID=208336 RepID=A0ABV0NMX3_9TELE